MARDCRAMHAPDEEKTLEQAVRSLSKFGDEGVSRFMEWHEMFKTED